MVLPLLTAKARADYDLRWKVALGIEVEERPFTKSTLKLFLVQLILNEKMNAVLTRSLEYANQTGYLKERRMKVILDTIAGVRIRYRCGCCFPFRWLGFVNSTSRLS